MTRKTKGTADVIDKHVGMRLRNRRALMGLSQEKLADVVDVTFQQVQKYERGTNRISASRLYTFSKYLGVSLDYFYEGLDEDVVVYGKAEDDETLLQIAKNAKAMPEDLLSHKETINLVRVYYTIRDKLKRNKVMSFINFIADEITVQEKA